MFDYARLHVRQVGRLHLLYRIGMTETGSSKIFLLHRPGEEHLLRLNWTYQGNGIWRPGLPGPKVVEDMVGCLESAGIWADQGADNG